MTEPDGFFRDVFQTGDAPLTGSILLFMEVPNAQWILEHIYNSMWALTIEDNWKKSGSVSVDDAIAASGTVIGSIRSMVGAIFLVGWAVIPEGFLLCDGTVYSRGDYPALYDVLSAVFHVDADNFTVPSMSGRVPVGEGSDFPVGDTGGEERHLLTESEMPSHAHSDLGHVHALAGEFPGLAFFPGELPVDVPGSGEFTAPGSANITNTGGDGYHNNMQPYLVLRYVIVAR